MEEALPPRLTTIALFRLSRIMMKTLDTAPIISLIRLPPLPKTGDLPNISKLENKKISHPSPKHLGITSIPQKLKSNHTLRVTEWHWMQWKANFNLSLRTSARKQMPPHLLEILAHRPDRMKGKIRKKAQIHMKLFLPSTPTISPNIDIKQRPAILHSISTKREKLPTPIKEERTTHMREEKEKPWNLK